MIAIIALVALSRYSLMAEDARVLRLQVISQHFMTGAANARIHYLVTRISGDVSDSRLDSYGRRVYFSEQGWPASVAERVTKAYQPSEVDCYHLWHFFLQNPPPIALGQGNSESREFNVVAHANNCRYQLVGSTAYFDYYPLAGELLFVPKSN